MRIDVRIRQALYRTVRDARDKEEAPKFSKKLPYIYPEQSLIGSSLKAFDESFARNGRVNNGDS